MRSSLTFAAPLVALALLNSDSRAAVHTESDAAVHVESDAAVHVESDAAVHVESDAAGPAQVRMTCSRLPIPGRMACEANADVIPGEAISWGELAIVRTPDFVIALRGRMGPHEAVERNPSGWRWRFAVIARTEGVGELEARVRLVVCKAGICEPRVFDVRTDIHSGP